MLSNVNKYQQDLSLSVQLGKDIGLDFALDRGQILICGEWEVKSLASMKYFLIQKIFGTQQFFSPIYLQNYVGPIILFYQNKFRTQGLTLGKPHPSLFVNSYILPNRSLSIQVL